MYSSYTFCVEAKLSPLPVPDSDQLAQNSSLIDSHMEMIVKTLLAAASDHIPVKKYFSHLKPGWTPELSTAHNRSKRAYKT